MMSSMSNGERRWASARRGGMTVLGKVAVPKPINLPSQRLENHGLDPSVEIVPKGTLSWGSRSSSSSNAWGSSTLSPHTDGGTGSPSHLSGRPSSGGNGTRPLTAGSDRATEPIANAWGPNSRPSSASGALTSNQTSLTSLRPRSAETRPGSSQLSRFAEPLSENPVAWAAAGTAEKLGVKSSKNDAFALTSGDFPTLGSEKDNSGKNTELQDLCSHGRSGSASPPKERTETTEVDANGMSGTVNSWRRDNARYSEDGIRPSVEKYQGEPQPYLNAPIQPQHYEPWRGPPVNSHPGGVWYGGPPGGPPYGAPVPPGGFPMEPFTYYRPQIPAAAIINQQPVLPQGARPRGHHPKNGDMYGPHIPDAYIRPGMPIRPGFYPGPVAYDSYYGPPMGYCNSSERDIPFMGMPAGPAIPNRYPTQNDHDSRNTNAKYSGYDSSGKTSVSEHMESGHPHDSQGPYKVLLKQHNGLDRKDEEQKWEDTMTSGETYPEKGDRLRTSWGSDCEEDHKKNEEMDSRIVTVGEDASRQSSVNRRSHFAGPVKVKSHENAENKISHNVCPEKKLENVSPAFPEVPLPVIADSKDSSLIQKIEGLNAKARASDGRNEVTVQSDKLRVNDKASHSENETLIGSIYPERTHPSRILNAASHEVGVSAGEKSLESTAATGAVTSRRSHGVQGSADHRGRGRFDTQEFDGRRKRSEASDPRSIETAAKLEASSSIHAQDFHTSAETTGKSWSSPQRNDEEESAPRMSDPSDFQTQRAKMRELAQQRIKQVQKEEDERISRQKANALAKLEELDRRTRSAEGSNQKSETVQLVASQTKQEDLTAEPIMIGGISAAPNSYLVSKPEVLAHISESSTVKTERSLVSLNEPPLLETPENTTDKEHPVAHNHSTTLQPALARDLSVSLQQDVNNVEAVQRNNASHFHEGSASKQKHAAYKQKQNMTSEKNPTERFVSTSTTKVPRDTNVPVHVTDHIEVIGNESAPSNESVLPVNTKVVEESVLQKRKYNRNAKNKNKVEASSTVSLAPLASSETSVTKSTVESVKLNVSESTLDPSSVQSLTESKDTSHFSDHCSSIANEEANERVNNLSKSQHFRKMPRNPQNRYVERFHGGDAVVWAPVRSQNKNEATDEASHVQAINPAVRSDLVQSNAKGKRAEMERYIPKHVAKEMAHHGSFQQLVPPVKQTLPDELNGRADFCIQGTESTQPVDTAIGKVETMESRNGDNRQNKQGKAHGSRRQRGLTESISSARLQDGLSSASNSKRNVETPTEHQGTWNHDLHPLKEQQKFLDENGNPDGWNIPDCTEPVAPVRVPVVKNDQEVTGRGKRHPFKGHRSAGQYHDLDHKRSSSGDPDKIYAQSLSPQMIQADLPATIKETRVGERSTSHWQQKSRAFSAANQQESMPNSSQNIVAEVAKAKLAPQAVVPVRPQHENETSERMAQHQHDQSNAGKSIVGEAPNVGHQAVKRERKMASLKGHHQASIGTDEQAYGSAMEQVPVSSDVQYDQRPSYGFRKGGSQNSHFGRGRHESRGDWRSTEEDIMQHNPPANQERQRHNSHAEYQPVGPYNSNKSNSIQGPKDGGNNTGPRFREKGQNHSRRGLGNFHPRQSGTLHVDSGYD